MTYTVRTIPEIEDDVTDVKHELTNIMVRAFEFGRYGSYE